MGPLTAILGDTADYSCPVSVSLLRCIRLSRARTAVAPAVPLLLHLKLQGCDAAAAALATKGEYLFSPHFQLAATGGDRTLGLGGLTPPAAATVAPAAASIAGSTGGATLPRGFCCCAELQQEGAQNRGSLLNGRSVFSVERQAIRCALVLLRQRRRRAHTRAAVPTTGFALQEELMCIS